MMSSPLFWEEGVGATEVVDGSLPRGDVSKLSERFSTGPWCLDQDGTMASLAMVRTALLPP